MTEGVKLSEVYDPETDCWFVLLKFTAKAYDLYKQEMEEDV